ncbi:MAG: alpha-galactosidase [Armatimonadetes bacterium]|nr:alpha-galactosidase [Armatimonadota bacterium]
MSFYRVITLEVLLMIAQASYAVTVSDEEKAECRRWVKAKIEGIADTRKPEASLLVIANNDPVQKNARGGKPMQIAGRHYTRGLYCHAVSKVLVRLPGPGKTFTAVVGVDSNEQTTSGKGSVIFSARFAGRNIYRSGVMREGMPGVSIRADLNGASELVLEVGDAGDGIACDQADWADACVTLEDGSRLWLGDLPIRAQHGPYTADPPFSFIYDGHRSSELLSGWRKSVTRRQPDSSRTEYTVIYADPATGLSVKYIAVEYRDFPTVEWTLHLKNGGSADTPIIEKLMPLDSRFDRNAEGEFALHHYTGSPCLPIDYQPHRTPMGPNAEKRIAAAGGRPTNTDLPYFNIEWPGEGVIAAVGWPGQWEASFLRDEGTSLALRAGQERTRFRLRPGEEVRTPLIVLQFYKGDPARAQNVWRRWMLAHNLPRPGGKLPPAQMAACSSHQYGEMINANEANQKMFVDRYLGQGLKLDYWWMDAGWYINETGWPNTGTWEVDTGRFPNGLRAITDYAHRKGVKSIVWFEPERVTPGTWLYQQHPEWLLGKDGGQKLLNLGHPEAWEWLVNRMDALITGQGIDLYRQDFNMDPLDYWRGNDPEDRQGITEIRHITGYLAYWDELRRRHPDMLIDSCASGGRRNDLETLRRAVPLLRSDYIIEPVGQQLHTYGIASWMPFYGAGVNAFDSYTFRSQMCPHITACYDMRNLETDFAPVRKLYRQWRRVADYYFGDYYPLTPYSPENDIWMAWQFDSPEKGEGMVQAFRRSGSIYESARLKLQGLDSKATYIVTDLDRNRPRRISGSGLMEKGLPVAIPDRPGAVVIVYKRQ